MTWRYRKSSPSRLWRKKEHKKETRKSGSTIDAYIVWVGEQAHLRTKQWGSGKKLGLWPLSYACLKVSGSQSDSQYKILLIRVDLKTFLGLAMPNQYCPAITEKIFGWFLGKI